MPVANAPIWVEIREDRPNGVINAWLASHPDIDQERQLLGTLNIRLADTDREAFDQWVGVMSRHVERFIARILAENGQTAKVIGSKRIQR